MSIICKLRGHKWDAVHGYDDLPVPGTHSKRCGMVTATYAELEAEKKR